jgi:hypothetical protein
MLPLQFVSTGTATRRLSPENYKMHTHNCCSLQLYNTFFCSLVGDTGWTVRRSNLGGGASFSSLVQNGRGAHTASYAMGTGSVPGVKWSRRDVDHTPPISTEVKEREELYFYSPSGPSWPVLGWNSPVLIPIIATTAWIFVDGYLLMDICW